jgi:hypothetical protein
MTVNSLSLAVPGTTAVSGTLTPRYEFISVLNETGVEIWVRTDGTAAVLDADLCSAVAPGERALLANTAVLWTQAQSVIPSGTHNQWGQSQAGGVSNPGTSISVIAVTTPSASTPTVTIQGAG